MKDVLVKAARPSIALHSFCLVMSEQQDHSKEDLFVLNRNLHPYLVKECD